MKSMILFVCLFALLLIPLCGCNQEEIAKQISEVKDHIDKANEQLQRLEIIAKAFQEAGIGIEDERMQKVMAAIETSKEVAEIGKEKLDALDGATGFAFPVLGAGGGTLGAILTGIGLIISVVKNITKSKQVVNLKTELKETTDGLDSLIRTVNEEPGIGAKIKTDAPLTTPAGAAIKARYDAVIPSASHAITSG